MAHSLRTASTLLHRGHRGPHPLLVTLTFRRELTSSEVSTALRPFFFLVHPDLFGLFPKEQAVNETSLKSLQSYLSNKGFKPASESVTFYLKDRQVKVTNKGQRSNLERVSVRLKAGELRPTVLSILRSANLPTSYVDSIQKSEGEGDTRSQRE